MAAIVVGHAPDIAEAHGEERLGALERLHLTFLVDAQGQRLIRRVEIEPDHIAQFLDEERVGRQLDRGSGGRVLRHCSQRTQHRGIL
jgi:hypothetical protein